MPPGSPSLPIGSLLRARYEVKNVLGSGNSGTVYLVKDQQVKRLKYNVFALKEIVGLNQQARYQFTFNGVALRQLQHPALPRIHHVFNDERHDRVYLVMDYVEGPNLENLRQQQLVGRFSWFELQKLFGSVCEALTYLHHLEKPLYHGDIKPTNIIRSITGKLLLVDIGYAQAITPDLLKQQVPGVFSSYRAPEYFTGKIDTYTDIYGLAATLYTLLTGQAPTSIAVRMQSIVKSQPDPLPLACEIAEGIPRYLAKELQRALAINPAERFPSVNAFWQALNTLPDKPSEHPSATIVDSTIEFSPVRATATEPAPVRNTPTYGNSSQSSLLLKIAVLCAALLTLIGAGTWLIAMHRTPATSSVSSTLPSSTGLASSSSSDTGHYPNLLGSYAGTLIPLGSSSSVFTLFVQHQQKNQISGTFSSTQQEGNFAGVVDSNGNLHFTVVNDAGDAVLAFAGGLNGAANVLESMGGTFSSCAPANGANCQSSAGLSGTWSLNHQSALPTPAGRKH
jgi:serine/threonine protein kinase